VPRKRLFIRKIKEALQLKLAGLGNREIGASIGAGKTTATNFWPAPKGPGSAGRLLTT
jgi:hypothetical protein